VASGWVSRGGQHEPGGECGHLVIAAPGAGERPSELGQEPPEGCIGVAEDGGTGGGQVAFDENAAGKTPLAQRALHDAPKQTALARVGADVRVADFGGVDITPRCDPAAARSAVEGGDAIEESGERATRI